MRVVKRVPPALVAIAVALVACGGEEAPEPTDSESASEGARTQAEVPEPVDSEPAERAAPGAEAARAAEPERQGCVVPAIPIPRPAECVRGRDYPGCKWQMPHATLADGRYRRWRNTIMEHWWGRPALVSFVLAATDRYHERFPDQVLAVGDLDAPGPRHQTHDKGVDVDIYLPGAMMVENAGGGRYPSNHEGKSADHIEATRQRVEGLARALAECAGGAVRIYYNDDVVLERFHQWYDAQGFDENPFGRPMQKHNHLHDFHFHISIPEDLAVLERPPLAAGQEDPIQIIEEPPDPSTAPNLASRNRNTTWMGGTEEGAESMDPTAMDPGTADATGSAMTAEANGGSAPANPASAMASPSAGSPSTMAPPSADAPSAMTPPSPDAPSVMAPASPPVESERDESATDPGG